MRHGRRGGHGGGRRARAGRRADPRRRGATQPRARDPLDRSGAPRAVPRRRGLGGARRQLGRRCRGPDAAVQSRARAADRRPCAVPARRGDPRGAAGRRRRDPRGRSLRRRLGGAAGRRARHPVRAGGVRAARGHRSGRRAGPHAPRRGVRPLARCSSGSTRSQRRSSTRGRPPTRSAHERTIDARLWPTATPGSGSGRSTDARVSLAGFGGPTRTASGSGPSTRRPSSAATATRAR